MVEHRTLTLDHTIFSWSQTDGTKIYCAWLPQLVLYWLYGIGGLSSLYALRYLCFLFLVAAVLFYAKKQDIARNPLTWFIGLLGFLMAYDSAGVLKPVIFSFIYMIILVGVWALIKSGEKRAILLCYCFPILTLVWVNSHGAIIFCAAFLGVVWIGETMNTLYSPRSALPHKIRQHLFVSLVLSALVIILNPYGIDYPIQLIKRTILGQNWGEKHTIADYRSIISDIGKSEIMPSISSLPGGFSLRFLFENIGVGDTIGRSFCSTSSLSYSTFDSCVLLSFGASFLYSVPYTSCPGTGIGRKVSSPDGSLD